VAQALSLKILETKKNYESFSEKQSKISQQNRYYVRGSGSDFSV
jgi:hypothetical protein